MNILLDTTLLLYAGTASVLLITAFIVVSRFQGPKIDKVSREQLKVLKTSELNIRKILNHEEHILFVELNHIFRENFPDFTVYPQVSMGELINADTDEAYNSFNCKRADFTVVDKLGYPKLFIEYHGVGHFNGNYMGRDMVKAAASLKAGIDYMPVIFDYDSETLKSDILEWCYSIRNNLS